MIFEGRHSLHRVTAVEGELPRYVGLLAYDTKPGTGAPFNPFFDARRA